MKNSRPRERADIAVAYQAQILPISVELGAYHAGHLARLYKAFHGDLLLPLILGEVATFNLRDMRADLPPDRATYVSADGSMMKNRSCNALSISMALGLPRETVRRKISALVDMGYLERIGTRQLRTTLKAFDDFAPVFNFETLTEFLATSDRVRKLLGAPRSSPKQHFVPRATGIHK